jgi:hypothetical protein
MWVRVRRPDGSMDDIDLPPDSYVNIGDILQDGSVIVDLQYPEDEEEEYIDPGYYEEEEDY